MKPASAVAVSPLVSVQQLSASLQAPDLLLVDTRFKLEDPDYGRAAHEQAHIPGAVYLDLDQDLSSPTVPGETGRHPLPDPALLEARLREIGLRRHDLVVVYDDGPGFFAARLWWLLHWLGHPRVAVLDGGFAAWQKAGLAVTAEQHVRPWPGDFIASPDDAMVISAEQILQHYAELQLLDARAAERFRGEIEPIDPVAGHIPGALCLPCAGNIAPDGLWRDGASLRQRFPALGDGQRRVTYCGSGVTACHNILAAAVAGLPWPTLYAGSWSEWIVDPSRPIATGDTDEAAV